MSVRSSASVAMPLHHVPLLRAITDHYSQAAVPGDVQVELAEILAILEGPERCMHCGVDPRRYTEGICKRCFDHRRHHGALPTEDSLLTRNRRDQHRRSA